MIIVQNLTQRYGNRVALSNVSFQVNAGECTGVFGLPGAGKTTLCDSLTGYMLCSPQTVYLNGLDIQKNGRETSRYISYMPEHAPIYLDMTPEQYLDFMCGLNHHKPKNKRSHIQACLTYTGLEQFASQPIHTLPMVVRRKIVLAGTIVSAPKILVLDQPFTGLHTEDAIELRGLVRKLKSRYTILLCSDTVSDITELCSKAIVLNGGKVVANNPIDQFLAFSGGRNRLRLRMLANPGKIRDAFSSIYEIIELTFQNAAEPGEIDVFIDAAQDVDLREQVWAAAAAANLPVLEMRKISISLEDVFLQLTSRTGEER